MNYISIRLIYLYIWYIYTYVQCPVYDWKFRQGKAIQILWRLEVLQGGFWGTGHWRFWSWEVI
jgi:hypothetical protein